MNSTLTTIVLVAVVASGVVSGLLWIFSNTVMGALGSLEPAEGIRAMQAINRVILNPIFIALFAGTAVVSLGLALWGVLHWQDPWGPRLVLGGALYVIGVFLVTGMGNVPLNQQLDGVDAGTLEAAELWATYLVTWTRLNTLRSIAGMVGTLVLATALTFSSGG